MLLKHLLSLVCFLLLTGCAGLNKKFDCPAKPGVTCKSMNEVNTLVDQGILPNKDCPSGKCKTIKPPHQDVLTAKQVTFEQNLKKVMAIWFAPFEENGIKEGDTYSNIMVGERVERESK